MKSFPILAGAVFAVGICQMALFAAPKKVLHMYGFGERPHGNIQQSVVDYIDELAQEHSFEVTHSKKAGSVENIGDYDVVFFNNTAFGAFKNAAEQDKIIEWFNGGGKAIGLHSSCDIRGKWDWWGDNVCAGSWYQDDFFGAFTLEADAEIGNNPAFKEMWEKGELGKEAQFPKTELYIYNANPRGKEGVTMFHTVGKDFSEIDDHPFGWVKSIGDNGGEYIYSALGHQSSDTENGWLKKATWAFMKYLTGDYVPVQDVDGKNFYPFARLNVEKNNLHIKDVGLHSVRIFDFQGRIRYDWRGSGEKVHEYKGLNSGVYYLKVKSKHLDYTRTVTIY